MKTNLPRPILRLLASLRADLANAVQRVAGMKPVRTDNRAARVFALGRLERAKGCLEKLERELRA